MKDRIYSPQDTSPEPLRICAVQCDIQPCDIRQNIQKIRTTLIKHRGSADLFVFPETITTGFSPEAATYALPWQGEEIEELQSLADEYGVGLSGSLLCTSEGKTFNRFFLISPHTPIQYQDKRHLFSIGGEADMVTPATEQRILEFRSWRIMPVICYDLRFPVWCRNVDNRYDLMLVVANWPEGRRSVWQTLLRARAMENLSYVVGVNRVGTDSMGLDYTGDSAIINPRGEVIAEATASADEVAIASIDYPALQKLRDKFPVWKDADKFSLHLTD